MANAAPRAADTDAGAAIPLPAAPVDLTQKLAELEARHAELSDAYLRAKADAENAR